MEANEKLKGILGGYNRHDEMWHRLEVGECVDLIPYYERKRQQVVFRKPEVFCGCGAPRGVPLRSDGLCWICAEKRGKTCT